MDVRLKRAYDAGVPLLCGTESGFSMVPYGEALQPAAVAAATSARTKAAKRMTAYIRKELNLRPVYV